MDAFAVAVATSVTLGRVTGRQVFRFSFHFGLFQAMMPLAGWLAGRSVQAYIETWDHWVAFGLLAFIGGKAVITAVKSPPSRSSSHTGDNDRASVVGRGPLAPPQPRSGDREGLPPDSIAPSARRRAEGDPPYTSRADGSVHGVPRRDPTRGLTLLMLSVATSIDALAVGLSLGMLRLGIWYPILIIGVVTFGLTVLGMLLGARLGSRFGRCTEFFGGLVLIGIGVKILIEHLY